MKQHGGRGRKWNTKVFSVVRGHGLEWATRFCYRTKTEKMRPKTVLLRTRKNRFFRLFCTEEKHQKPEAKLNE
jgi:hypothetical protein